MKEKDKLDKPLTEQQIEKAFYDPKFGLTGLDKFYKKLKLINNNVDYKTVKKFYQDQEVNQLTTVLKRPKVYNTVTANYAGYIYEIDIIIYDRYELHKYKYILVCIDVYSRFAVARAMTNRKLETIIKNVDDIFHSLGSPYEVKCDNEFNKEEFIKLCKKYDVRCRFSDPYEINKNPIVERVNRTIAMNLQKIRIATGRKDWYNYLEDAIVNYNTSHHKTIKNSPYMVWVGKEYNEQKIIELEPTFKVGDRVRIQIKKKVFDKGDTIKYSKPYRVKEVKGKRYLLDDGTEIYYKPYEIKKVADILYKEDYEPEEPEVEEPKNIKESEKIVSNYILRQSQPKVVQPKVTKPKTKTAKEWTSELKDKVFKDDGEYFKIEDVIWYGKEFTCGIIECNSKGKVSRNAKEFKMSLKEVLPLLEKTG